MKKHSLKHGVDIWNKFLSGDKDAFTDIYKKYVADLFQFGFRICKDHGLVQDTLQELFVSLWQQRNTLPKVKHVKTYLIVSLRNRLLRKIQQEQKTKIYNIDDFLLFALSSESETITEAELLAKKVKSKVETLPLRQREVLHLKYYQNLSHDEIATIMNINYQSVANLLGRAINKLKVLWSETKGIKSL